MLVFCIHCKTNIVSRARGLCSTCYKNPVIKESYPLLNNNFRKSTSLEELMEHTREPPLPDEPTTAIPGTEEKVAVMEKRWDNKRQIHHPDDWTYRTVGD